MLSGRPARPAQSGRLVVTVLLVDDFVDALEVWTLFLSAAGFTVATAATATATERRDKPRLLNFMVIVLGVRQ